jgi:hypothetical protein
MFGSRSLRSRRQAAATLRPRLHLEPLEPRNLLATVTVNVDQIVRAVNAHVLGLNINWWDTNLNTAQTEQMVAAAGLTMFRFPGGSSSDDWHFNAGPTYGGEGTSPSMASFVSALAGTGMVTLDYGSGSPQEAAAFLAYLNAPVTNTTPIGPGEEWSDTTNAWFTADWKSADYWAGLRAAMPLGQDDGLNFLRLGRTQPFGMHYFEVGNEIYGSWEIDHHGSGGDTGQPHDPATYVAFAKQFATYAALIDSSISIGIDAGSIGYDNNWVANVLQQGVTQGFTPGFISDHSYMQAPGAESDSFLLLDTVSDPNNQDPNSPLDWPLRAAGYRNLLQQELGTAASGVELLATEYNSVYSNPGKQTTSLVNGLFVADSLGSILQTEYNASLLWDLRNSWSTSNNNSSSLYGWREGGDYGILGDSTGQPPATGTYVPYPTYFAEQLVSKMVYPNPTDIHGIIGGSGHLSQGLKVSQRGALVVDAASSSMKLSVYAVWETNGHLDLLVINKNATVALTGQFQITGFQPSAQAQFWQYGETQDTAQSQTMDGSSALANFNATLSLNGSNFNYTFPAYSMTVIDLTPSSGSGAAAGALQVLVSASNPPSADIGNGKSPRRAEPPSWEPMIDGSISGGTFVGLGSPVLNGKDLTGQPTPILLHRADAQSAQDDSNSPWPAGLEAMGERTWSPRPFLA